MTLATLNACYCFSFRTPHEKKIFNTWQTFRSRSMLLFWNSIFQNFFKWQRMKKLKPNIKSRPPTMLDESLTAFGMFSNQGAVIMKMKFEKKTCKGGDTGIIIIARQKSKKGKCFCVSTSLGRPATEWDKRIEWAKERSYEQRNLGIIVRHFYSRSADKTHTPKRLTCCTRNFGCIIFHFLDTLIIHATCP